MVLLSNVFGKHCYLITEFSRQTIWSCNAISACSDYYNIQLLYVYTDNGSTWLRIEKNCGLGLDHIMAVKFSKLHL